MSASQKTRITLTIDEYEHLCDLLSVGLDFYRDDDDGEHEEYKEMNKKLYSRFTKGLERIKRNKKI